MSVGTDRVATCSKPNLGERGPKTRITQLLNQGGEKSFRIHRWELIVKITANVGHQFGGKR